MEYKSLIENLQDFIEFIQCKNKHAAIEFNLKKILKEARDELFIYENTDEEKELLKFLDSFAMRELCIVHDKIAKKEFHPILKPIPFEVDEDELCVKICELVKTSNEPLGATIKEVDQANIVIARIMDGGSIGQTNLLEVGDRILEINDNPVQNAKPEEIISLLSQQHGCLKMTIQPFTKYYCEKCDLNTVNSFTNDNQTVCDVCCQNDEAINPRKLYLRSLFDYNPKLDAQHPCEQAGLELHIGDILEICDYTHDKNWWQARLLATPQYTNKATLHAITNLLTTIEMSSSFYSNKKDVACLIPSYNWSTINQQQSTYEELCIFDPIYQHPRRRPIIITFAFNNQLVSSLKSEQLEYSFLFHELLHKLLSNIEKFNTDDLSLNLPSLYRVGSINNQFLKQLTQNTSSLKKQRYSTSAPSSPFLTRRNSTKPLFTSTIQSFIQKSEIIYLNRSEWTNENRNENLMQCMLDDGDDDGDLSYKLDEMFKTFLDFGEQLVTFPTPKSLFQLRNSCLFNKLGYYVLFNIQSEKPTIPSSSPDVDDVMLNKISNLYDLSLNVASVESINSTLNEFNSSIVKINQIPSFVIK